mgnify:CR=1 FL=1
MVVFVVLVGAGVGVLVVLVGAEVVGLPLLLSDLGGGGVWLLLLPLLLLAPSLGGGGGFWDPVEFLPSAP